MYAENIKNEEIVNLEFEEFMMYLYLMIFVLLWRVVT
jgi:hypothetical protein